MNDSNNNKKKNKWMEIVQSSSNVHKYCTVNMYSVQQYSMCQYSSTYTNTHTHIQI